MGRAVSGRVSVTIAAGCVRSRFSKMILEPRLPTAAMRMLVAGGVSSHSVCMRTRAPLERSHTRGSC